MIVLVIPSCNAGQLFENVLNSIHRQSVQPHLLLIDSESTDSTVQLAISANFEHHTISRKEFNHGSTRQLALSLYPHADIIIYMTQDAILSSTDSIKNIIDCFVNEKIGAVCGRQLPHAYASPITAHARLFNYPDVSSIKSKDSISKIGIKAAFLSNSFAAYRSSALTEVGGFPSDAIFGEDTYVAAKLLQAGWKVAYCAEAACYHSHNYSIKEEFERYFDIGVFHSRERWFIESLGKPEGEGKKFVLSELHYLTKNALWLIPSAIVRTLLKFIGYKFGQNEKLIPDWLKLKLSMNKGYWKSPQLHNLRRFRFHRQPPRA